MKTGSESLEIGAPKITYSGNEGPKPPQQMAMADPLLVEEYQKYVFEMEEQGLTPMSFEEFKLQAMSGMAEGGVAQLVKKNEGKIPRKYLDQFLDFADISMEEFLEICDKFTNKNIFKTDAEWKIVRDEFGEVIKMKFDNS